MQLLRFLQIKKAILKFSGYVWVEQSSLEEKIEFPDLKIDEYREDILTSEYSNKYLSATRYWESTDPYIQEEAKKLSNEKTTLYDLISTDYKYVNDQLEYDNTKATSRK